MADATDSDIKHTKWSVRGHSINELVAKFSLPILVKAVNSSKSHGTSGIVAHEIYRIKRLLRVQTIRAHLMSSSESDVLPLEIRIPKDYRGPFQITPVESSMYRDVSLEDVVKYRPRYIKVVKTVSNITTGVHIDLNAGDELEVIGTRKRATKTGLKDYLKLRKKYREFILNPDCEGMFQVVEDSTLYTLHDILERFPLPQKVSLVNIESHSEVLLTLFPSGVSEATTLMLKDNVQDEYVVGEDLQKQIRAILHIDAELYFYVPDSISPSYVEKEQLRMTKKKTDGDVDNEQIFIDQLICLAKDTPVICGAAGEVFKKLFLHPRTATSHVSEHGESPQHLLSLSEEQGCYTNVEIRPTISRDQQFGKVGVGLPMRNDMPDCPPPIPPKPPTGQGDKHNVKLLTPEETRDVFADNSSGRRECESEPLYDVPETGSDHSDDEDDDDYEQMAYDDENDSDSGNSYESIPHDMEDTLLTNVSIEDKHQMEDEKSNGETKPEYENTARAHPIDRQIKRAEAPQFPQAITHQETNYPYPRTVADSTEIYDAVSDDIPPELPPRLYLPSSATISASPTIDPKYGKAPNTQISEVFRKSVRGVDRLPSSPIPDVPPKPPGRHSFFSAETCSVQAQSRRQQRRETTKECWQPQTATPATSISHRGYEVHLPPMSDEGRTELETSEEVRKNNRSSPQQLPDLITNEGQMETGTKPQLPTNQEELRKLSVKQVVKVLETLKFDNDVQARFQEDGIDGELLCSLEEGDLRQDFGLSKFHALKIVKFINGWRPLL
ncbi:uncharacterized protein [Amphiura filiformis]|uniref:uncharacterized protein n=1 Tax=Amphiura filiformis TaxID=82378 RepID=UPI003B2190AA